MMSVTIFKLKQKIWYISFLAIAYTNYHIRKLFKRGESALFYKKIIVSFKKGFDSVYIYNKYPSNFIKKKDRLVVYTCLYGNDDVPKKIHCQSKYCDYFIFTDQTVDKKTGWTKLDFMFPEKLGCLSNVQKNRFIKMHPHLLFPDYKYSLYVDSKLILKNDVYSLLARINNGVFGFFKHVKRRCLYKEAEMCIAAKGQNVDFVNLQMSNYKKDGFPPNYGLTENSIILRQHMNPICIKIMEEWWLEFNNKVYSKRDQLSLMYVFWKNGLCFEDVAVLGENFTFDKRFEYRFHLKDDPLQKERYCLYLPGIGQLSTYKWIR